jgi:hypothetical protein
MAKQNFKHENDQAGQWLKKQAAKRKQYFRNKQRAENAAQRRIVREANKRI